MRVLQKESGGCPNQRLMTNITIPYKSAGLALSLYGNQDSSKIAFLLTGFLDSQDYKHVTSLGRALVDLDYFVVSFDPYGTWKSGGQIANYSTSEYIKNVQAVINYIRQTIAKNAQKILLIGHSLGGLIATYLAITEQNVTAVIAIMPPPNQKNLRPEKLQLWKKTGVRVFERNEPSKKSIIRKMVVPYSYIQDAQSYDLLVALKKISNIPLLVISSTADDLIDPQEIESVLKMKRGPYKHVVLDGVDHHYRQNKQDIQRINTKIMSFIADF